MANPRKVQGEIDKLVKKIGEGIEEYEGIYDKFAEAATPALKERFEGDLKKEIKKLQRLREQVKALVQSNEVKDKKELEKARRRVEEKMEAFKIVERETKTKAFSKEGLANLSSNQSETPQQRTEGWIKMSISELKEQTETAEFEIHQAENGGGGASASGAAAGRKAKGKKKSDPSDDPREIRLVRLRANTLKLEQLLRCVVNEDLAADEVDEIEDDVQRFIDENAEEDFVEDLELYDRFDLPDIPLRHESDDEDDEKAKLQKLTPATPAAPPPPGVASTPVSAASVAAKKPATVTKGPDTPPSAAAKAPLTPLSSTSGKSTPAVSAAATVATAPAVVVKKDAAAVVAAAAVPPAQPATAPAAPAFAKKSVAQVVAAAAAASAAPAANKAPAAAPPAKSFAAAAAAAAQLSTGGQNNTPSSAVVPPAKGTPSQAGTFPSGPKFGSSLDDGLGADDALLDEANDEANDDTFGDDAMPVSNSASLADMASNRHMAEFERQRMASKQQAAPMSGGAIVPPRAVSSGDSPNVSSPNQSAAPPVPPQPAALSPQQPTSAPSASAASTATVWSALLKGQQPSEEKVAMHRMLDMSLQNLPHPHDVERTRPFVPPNPYATKPHHPQVVHPGFSSPDMFRRFDPDTLFFVFYYQQQTYQQYLAAKELKRQSFRYHKKFRTWFQRHDKPKESTDDFESGAYLYFDYENGWCQRIKNDFVFKYTYLEDDLV